MQHIYQVVNSYHLLEGLDSEFLIIAESDEEAKDTCLHLLTEDQPMHIATIRENIDSLKKSLNKDWGEKEGSPAYVFIERANARSRENIDNYTRLLQNFDGYKRECLTVRRINSRLKNGQIQYE